MQESGLRAHGWRCQAVVHGLGFTAAPEKAFALEHRGLLGQRRRTEASVCGQFTSRFLAFNQRAHHAQSRRMRQRTQESGGLIGGSREFVHAG